MGAVRIVGGVRDVWTLGGSSRNMTAMHLGALIDAVEQSDGLNDRDIVRRAERRDFKLNATEISDWRREGMGPQISPKKVHALAAGLGVAPWRVAVAALCDHGIVIPVDKLTAEQAIAADAELPAAARRVILAALREARDS